MSRSPSRATGRTPTRSTDRTSSRTAARTADRAATRQRGRAGASRPPEQTVLISAVTVLCGLSVVMVYSASSVYAQRQFGSTWAVVVRHGAYVAIGVALAWLGGRIPLRVWRDRLTPILLAVAFIGLVLVAVPGMPLAPDVNGASRWLRVGPLGFQPSDLAKLALVLWLARLLTVNRTAIGSTDLLRRVLVVFVPLAALVLLGDDLGTTMLLGLVFVTMLFLAGAPLGQVGALSGAMAGAGMLSILFLEGFRAQRVLAYLRPSEHSTGAAYQTLQSQIGFASGGLWGQGPGASKAKWGFLPEAHTDFILAVIGEELGLIGSVAIIGALAAVVASGIVIGIRCRDPYGRLVAFGISTWLGIQAVINVGVSVGALPTKGIPLPFVSYGGTAMTVSLVAVGVLLAVSRAPATARPRTPATTRSRR